MDLLKVLVARTTQPSTMDGLSGNPEFSTLDSTEIMYVSV